MFDCSFIKILKISVFSLSATCVGILLHVLISCMYVLHQELSQKSLVYRAREVTTARHLDLTPTSAPRVPPVTTAAKVGGPVYAFL